MDLRWRTQVSNGGDSRFAVGNALRLRVLFFAKHADIEGYPEIAGLFQDTAEGEFV